MLTTEAVDRLSIPFGLVIGPATVASNTIKLVSDVAQMLFFGLISINVNSEEADRLRSYLKDAKEDHYSSATIKGHVDHRLTLRLDQNTRYFHNYYSAKYTVAQHVKFIGIGIIRTVPLLGGLYRTYSK